LGCRLLGEVQSNIFIPKSCKQAKILQKSQIPGRLDAIIVEYGIERNTCCDKLTTIDVWCAPFMIKVVPRV